MSRAIIIGGAMTAWAEYDVAHSLMPDAKIIAANHAARDHIGHVDHFVTMHSDMLPKWIRERAAKGLGQAGQYWHARHRACPIPNATPIESWGGSSGLLCVAVALHLGFDRIILCGVPLDQNGCHYDRPKRKWIEAAQYRSAWERRLPEMTGKVKSMGGWSARLLGHASKEWIDGDEGTT